jgi:predicted nuclease of restriction endonuclease-like (RecB) superfamily
VRRGILDRRSVEIKLTRRPLFQDRRYFNNFLRTLPIQEQARRAIRAFKDEYLLDFINIEDENDPDERLIEHGIIANIKQFILAFGNKFCFIGNQYRVVVEEQEFFIDFLFFNRELRCCAVSSQ